MFATLKSFIPEPRHADEPRHYVGRHRHPEAPDALETTTPKDPNPGAVAPAALATPTLDGNASQSVA